MIFCVRVRIDLIKMPELGQKLQNGELDLSNIKTIYCMKDDPSVGISFWEAENEQVFREKFKPHCEYYREVEIIPMITSVEAQQILMKQTAGPKP
jgi:hypothetical protein